MKTNTLNRRDFLSRSSVGLVGTGAGLMNSDIISGKRLTQSNPEPGKIKEFRLLGRTGFSASDIGCGTMGISNENVLKELLNAGVNFIDTAEAYANGNNELMVGRALKETARNSIFINTKISVEPADTVESIKTRVGKCLERLQTGYIDGLMLWGATSVETIKSEVFHKAVNQLKSEGRVKHGGVSCHGTSWNEEPRENMEQVIHAAVDDGRFDLVMFVYNYVQQEMGENILKACAKKNIGTVLMKTDPFGGAYLSVLEMVNNLMKENKPVPDEYQKVYNRIKENQKKAETFLNQNSSPEGHSQRETAIGFVLNNPAVNTVLISFRNFEDIGNYVRLSGTRLTGEKLSLINSMKNTFSYLYCRHACGLCEGLCPSQVQVNRIMRYNHYFMAQAREKYAMQKYHMLTGPKAAKCLSCEGYCEKGCPYEVPIRLLLAIAHRNLSLNLT